MIGKIKKLLQQVSYILNHRQKVELIGMAVVVMFTTAVELVGVTAILPIINVMTDEKTIETNSLLNWIYSICGFESTTKFLILLCALLILVYVIKNALTIVSYNYQYKFTFQNQKKMASKLLKTYLSQEYSFHLNRSSAELIRSINTDLVMMFQGILALIGMFAELFVCAALGVYLLYTDAMITGIITITLAVVVLFYTKKFKGYIKRVGEEDRKYSLGIVKWLQQSFGGLKETKILHREVFFLDRFTEQYDRWADLERIYRNLQMFPKPVMESLCIAALMMAIIIKLLMGVAPSAFIGTVSVFAVAAFRLLPSFNRITGYLNAIVFYYPAFDAVYQEIKEITEFNNAECNSSELDVLPFEEGISIRNLSYKYPMGDKEVLKGASLEIPKNKSVAFIGPSGSGKTTLVDIILGVLKPVGGQVLIDGQDEFKNLDLWQKKVGYIAQTIYLMDDTIRNNILYGVDEPNEMKLAEAIKKAQLSELIDSLPDGIDTEIGEGGIRLSGGQRQRIGIARALYNDPDVLVLDEATSALDNDTEKAIMDAIDALSGEKTLIIIAHRLTTIVNCDIVYEVEDGNVSKLSSQEFQERLNKQIMGNTNYDQN